MTRQAARITAATGLLAGAMLLLAGCFISARPFITPATADYPYAPGTILQQFHHDKSAAGGWAPVGRWKIVREGAYYKLTGLPADDNSDVSEPFLIKCLDPVAKCKGRYAISQLHHTDPKGRTYYAYALLEFTNSVTTSYRNFHPGDDLVGEQAADHQAQDECAKLGDNRRRILGIALKDFEDGKSCEVPSFEVLRKLFLAYAREGAPTDEIYVNVGID